MKKCVFCPNCDELINIYYDDKKLFEEIKHCPECNQVGVYECIDDE